MADVSKRITSSDPDYDAIHEKWVEQGRPSQFDVMFMENLIGTQDGGGIFQVLDTSAAEPDFYMRYSRGPTIFDEESASENPTQRGWLLINLDYFKWKLWPDRKGRFKVKHVDGPNDLM